MALGTLGICPNYSHLCNCPSAIFVGGQGMMLLALLVLNLSNRGTAQGYHLPQYFAST